MDLSSDWQTTTQKISERSKHLLETGQWSDCKFIVGQEPSQQILVGHKVLLAMSSPVFEAMFYGTMAKENYPVAIPDVQPEAFKALLEYIYTDNVHLGTFELACELCYCAKKYMLPFLVKKCTKFLWSDLSLKTTCRAFEFAKLFDEPVLMQNCLQIICSKTENVLREPSWEDVEQGTVLALLDQEELQISSEVDLFNALERWAKAECGRKLLDSLDTKALKSVIGNALTKIRFLTLTPQEFAEGPGKSLLLTQQEAFSILMNISSIKSKVPMPENFSVRTAARSKLKIEKNRDIRRHCVQDSDEMQIKLFTNFEDRPKFYCIRSTVINPSNSVCHNFNMMECSVNFNVDRNICVLGVEVPTQICDTDGNCIINENSPTNVKNYREILHVYLLDECGAELGSVQYVNTVNPSVQKFVEISFHRPICIEKYKRYEVRVVFKMPGLYTTGFAFENVICEHVLFLFHSKIATSDGGKDYFKSGLIRSIVFTCP